ncbi:MAG TPA: PAS domain S-box protein [Gammaproteobacteria bacterium]
MNETFTKRPSHQYAWLTAVFWTLLVIVSFAWNLANIKSQVLYLAKNEAVANWNKDQAFRRWAARHGGVYVQPDERTPPSPYISHLPHRDLTTTEGIKLTLMNPAYMMRQMTEEFESLYGIKGKITGSQPLNPGNLPDAWEASAIQRFHQGETEVIETAEINNEPFLRLIKPMVMATDCLLCHGSQGFKVGDISGGVSVSIPLSRYLAGSADSRNTLMLTHGSIWLMGLLGIAVVNRRMALKEEEQLKTNAALEKSQQEWLYAMDYIEDAVYLVDMDDRIIRANKAFYLMTGLTPDQAIGRDIMSIIHPHGETVPCPVCNARRERNDARIVLEADHPDNPAQRPIEVTVRIIRDQQNNPLTVLMAIHDLTRTRQIEAEIKESEQRLRDILESTAEGILVLDLDGKCILANTASARYLGYDNTTALLGKSTHELIHHTKASGEAYAEIECPIHGSLQNGSKTHSDSDLFWRGDGSSFPVEYWSYPIYRDQQQVAAVVTFFDISERSQTEVMLRRAQKMEALGQLTGGIAHDFNNQLGVVLGYLELLEDKFRADDKTSRWLSHASKATHRCIDLTKQLLTFSRRQQVETEIINLNENMKDIQELIQRSLTPEVIVEYKIQNDVWLIETSRGEMEDALLNIIMNARDAMPNGGKLNISIYNQSISDKDRKTYQNIETGDYVVIAVHDTGAGIADDVMEHVFDPFFTTKEIGKGTGLGLAMVYGYVKRNNGYILLESEVEKGTQVKLLLPRITLAASPAPLSDLAIHPYKRGQGQLILVVDDEEKVGDLASEILNKQGYATMGASNGKNALELLRRHPNVCLLFTDVIMPGGMNGYELAEQAKALKPDLKILLASGYTEKEPANQAQSMAAQHFINKPYSREQLLRKIEELLEAED